MMISFFRLAVCCLKWIHGYYCLNYYSRGLLGDEAIWKSICSSYSPKIFVSCFKLCKAWCPITSGWPARWTMIKETFCNSPGAWDRVSSRLAISDVGGVTVMWVPSALNCCPTTCPWVLLLRINQMCVFQSILFGSRRICKGFLY